VPARAARSARRGALAALVAVAAALGGAAPAALAVDAAPRSAPGTDEVTGTLVRAYDEGDGFDGVGHDHDEHEDEHGDGHGDGHGDEHDGARGDAGLVAWVEDGRDTVRVPAEDVDHVPTGATVEVVVGDELADEAAEGGLEPAREVLDTTVLATERPPTAAALAVSTHRVTLVLAVPAGGARDGATPAGVASAVEGPVSAFWSGQTGGAVTFDVTAATDWVELAAGCDDPNAMWSEAARRSGFTQGANEHLVLYVGDRSGGCSAGLATVGSGPSAGGLSYVTSTSTSLVAHELGHNLGLYHSAKLRCDGVVEADAGCSVSEYLDLYDVMGGAWSRVGSLSAPQAHRLGTLEAAEGVDVAGAGGTYTLAPISSRGRVRAVRLRDGARTYWIELRAPAGQDSWLATGGNSLGLQPGVVVRREVADPSSHQSLLLDPSPSAPAAYDRDHRASLAAGTSTTVSAGRWRVEVGAITGSGATVTVTATAAGTTATPGTGFTGTATAPPRTAPRTAVARHDGASRYETAVAISAASHPAGARAVVVASGEAFPDALAAGPAAARGGGPLLLVPRSGEVPAAVVAELRRLAPAAITLAGGPSAVDAGVEAQLAAVAPVTRVAGEDRFDTAARLATTSAAGSTVFLASGATHADAVAGAALAARTGGSVLLATRDGLPPATAAALAALAPAQVVVLGGTASLGSAVDDGVRAAAPGAQVQRRAGQDRYDTASLVAEAGYPDGAGTVYLALGDAFPDALAGGPAAGASGSPLLLTRGACVPAVTLERLAALGAERVVILGGSRVVGAEVEALTGC
jgi:putative cell wall-binding protein